MPSNFYDLIVNSDTNALREIVKDLGLWEKKLPSSDLVTRSMKTRFAKIKQIGMAMYPIRLYAKSTSERAEKFERSLASLRIWIGAKFQRDLRHASEMILEMVATGATLLKRIFAVGAKLAQVVSRAFRGTIKVVTVTFAKIAGVKTVVRIWFITFRGVGDPGTIDQLLFEMLKGGLDSLVDTISHLQASVLAGRLAAFIIVCP